MSRTFLLSLLFFFGSYSGALALIDLNALSAESSLSIEQVTAQEREAEEGERVEKVEVVRKQRGLLLALVPITFTVKATAYPDGKVELNYPWYSAITVDHEEEIKAKVRIAVDNALKTRLVGSVKAEGESANPSFTAREAEMVEEKIIEVLSTSL